MGLLKSGAILILSLFLLIGTVGFNVFEHICKKEGVTISYFVNSGENLCKEKHDFEASKSCCHHKKKSENNKGCCSNEVEYFKLKIDARSDMLWKVDFPNYTVISEYPKVVVQKLVLQELYSMDYIDPPPIDSKEIRILKQVWTI